VQFTQFAAPQAWQPAINAYRCSGQITVCVDLAGVDREAVGMRVEPRRLVIRGSRELPESAGKQLETLQVLEMEIDYGNFERHLDFPVEVDPRQVTVEQRNGLLWIFLPLLQE
jgi:HSP20 family protein